MKLLETPHSLEFRDHLFDLTAATAVGADAHATLVSLPPPLDSTRPSLPLQRPPLAQKEWQEQTSTFFAQCYAETGAT